MAMDARASGTTAAPVTGSDLPPPPAAGPGAPGLPAPGAAGCVDDDVEVPASPEVDGFVVLGDVTPGFDEVDVGSLGLDELDVG